MASPLLYFSYGMTKCGSTLAFHLASVALQQAGYPQPKAPPPVVQESRKLNYVKNLDKTAIKTLWDFACDLGHPIVLKTHTIPDPAVIDFFQQGKAMGSASYRDPRDMALSMLDHGEKAREKGQSAFAEIESLADAEENLHHQSNRLTKWLQLPNILPLYYDEIAFNSESVVNKIAAQMGIEVDPVIVAKIAKRQFTQFNKGIPNRHITEMQQVDSDRIVYHFTPMYQNLIDKREKAISSERPTLRWYNKLNRGRGRLQRIFIGISTFLNEKRKSK